MKVLSLFDGMGCGYQALKCAGIAVTEYHAYEVDKHAIQVAKKNHPDIIHHGEINFMTDFTQYKGFDLLIGGSPCQGFSAAGKGLNFTDPRSQLFFEFVRAKREMKPRFFMLENVKMKKEWLAVIDEHMGVQSVRINSALVSAQNRVRHYWCNWAVSQPADRGLLLRDIIERDIEPEPNSAGWHKWFEENKEFQLTKGYSAVLGDDDKAITMTARQYGSWNGNFVPVGGAVRGRNIVDGKRKDYLGAPTEQRLELRSDEKSNCITTVGKDSVLVVAGKADDKFGHDIQRRIYSDNGKSPTLLAVTTGGAIPPKIKTANGEQMLEGITYRKLTPIECERLQGLPCDYTNVVDCKTYRVYNHLEAKKQEAICNVRLMDVRENLQQKNSENFVLNIISESSDIILRNYQKNNLNEIKPVNIAIERLVKKVVEQEECVTDTIKIGSDTVMLLTPIKSERDWVQEVTRKQLTVRMPTGIFLRITSDELSNDVKKFITLIVIKLITELKICTCVKHKANIQFCIGNLKESQGNSLNVELSSFEMVTTSSLVSDSQRYKMLGNGWQVDTIEHIFKEMPL